MESERNILVSDIKKMFEQDLKRNIFKKFIEYIRFPFFKNFEKDTKVKFDFPITFIVGQNGSGKSSLLHALYGAPEGKSVEDFWYTTDLDPIEDLKNNRHCFIYSYKTEFTKTDVEILKTRIKNRDKSGKINPDYWEPSRPVRKYWMITIPKNVDEREASKTRWNVLKKEVYHLDFRYSLSAYDKYFYFGSKPNSKTLKTKQDLIRKFAPKLRKAFEKENSVTYYSRKVFEINNLNDDEIRKVEKILGKKYNETKFLIHNFYDRNKGFAIRYKTNTVTYSEAYAGSGEIAVVKLVRDLLNAQDYSLILLDEPETSLHPLAQKRLINFILEQVKKKKLQVIISTHSPDIIEGMPFESIKILYENQNTGKINIIENVYPENAFVHIGRTISDKKSMLVEDKLAKMIIEAVLKETRDTELFEVTYHPGGESQIKQNEMVVYSKEDNSKHFIVFDGDQKKEKIDISTLSDNEKEPNNLENIIKELVGQKVKFAFNSNATNEQKTELMLKYIKYHYDNVFFLPKDIPEEIIWDNSVLEKSDFSNDKKDEIKKETDFKKKFTLYASEEYGSDKSEDIEQVHKKFIKRWINDQNTDFNAIKDIIEKIKEH